MTMTRSSGSPARSARLRWQILRAAASAMVAGSVVPLIAPAAVAQEAGCPSYFAGHSVVGSAAGVQIVEAARGVTIVESADGALPGAQAAVDSLLGSVGFAGAPYSGTASDNVGQADSEPNDVPTFAVSSFPAEPNEVEKSPPGARLTTASGPTSSTAAAETGGASAGLGRSATESVNAHAQCSEDSLAATASNTAESLTFADVLSIGSVRSDAKSVLGADGSTKLEASLSIEGAAVAGQPVSITEEGVSLLGNVIEVPGNPAADALEDSGVTVTYLGERRNEETGEITAPALEIVVTQALPVGSGPTTTTFVVGQAFARASVSSISKPLPTTPATFSAEVAPTPGSSSGGGAPAPAGEALPKQAPSSPTARLEALATGRIANWSILPAFSALLIGTVLFVGSWILFGRLTARLRWT